MREVLQHRGPLAFSTHFFWCIELSADQSHNQFDPKVYTFDKIRLYTHKNTVDIMKNIIEKSSKYASKYLLPFIQSAIDQRHILGKKP